MINIAVNFNSNHTNSLSEFSQRSKLCQKLNTYYKFYKSTDQSICVSLIQNTINKETL